MAIPAAAIAAAATVASTAGSAYAQGKMNKKSIKFAREMYGKQREDALSDWAMQNEYNSPEAQMARYKEAGLSPHLIYGQSNTADAVRSSSASQPSLKAANFDHVPGQVRDSLLINQDLKMRTAQSDNLTAQNTVLVQEALLKAAQTAATLTGTDKTKFDLEMAQSLKESVIAAAEQNVKKMQADTQYTLNNDERAAAANAMSLKEAAERILQLKLQQAKTTEETNAVKKQIQSLDKDNQLKQLDIDLKEKGIQPGDNIFFRILGRLMEKYMPSSLMPEPKWK